jgi:hypothetical protein
MNMKLTIKIGEIVGPNCVTFDDGQVIYSKIVEEIKAGNPVTLDFTGTKIFASPFFNGSVGSLFKDIESEKLNRLLEIINLNDDANTSLRRVIENAKKYYSDSAHRTASDNAIQSQSEDA